MDIFSAELIRPIISSARTQPARLNSLGLNFNRSLSLEFPVLIRLFLFLFFIL